jgi:hypothetical protein
VLDRITQEHPSTKEMHITSLSLVRERSSGGNSRVVLDGLARQQTTASEFNTKLNDGTDFSARPAGHTELQKNNRGYPYRFKSEITLKRETTMDGSELEPPREDNDSAAGKREASKKQDAPKKKPSKNSK